MNETQIAMNALPEFTIERGFIPGAIGRIAELHGAYYHAHWGFGPYFEAKVAAGLAEFFPRLDPDRDGLWLAIVNGRVEGSIVIDGLHAKDKGAHLRWFILSEALRGKGVGRQLIDRAREFWTGRGYRKVYLWTFEGLHAARRLYEDAGFKLIAQQRGTQWGTAVNEQHFEWTSK